MSEMQEYIVTAKTMDDATSLLDDMETPGGDLYIPSRQVEVPQRREISRNTHFLITEEEANQLRNDLRVLAVELLPSLRGIVPVSHWTKVEILKNRQLLILTIKIGDCIELLQDQILQPGEQMDRLHKQPKLPTLPALERMLT